MTVEGGVADLGIPPDELPMPAWRSRARPEHVAEYALYLASNRAAFITGSVQVIDGGLTANMG
jgi:NAD(P)-dependent dehydrogenase (short-subunit alcohol dehydrogenase family)